MDKFYETRNDYLIRLFRKYATGNKVDKCGVREILQEVHSLLEKQDTKGDDLPLQMTGLQFEQVFKVLMKEAEKDERGRIDKKHLYPM